MSELCLHVMRGDRVIARTRSTGRLRPLLQLARQFTRPAVGHHGDGWQPDRAYVFVGGADLGLIFVRVKDGWRIDLHDDGAQVWGKDAIQGGAL